MKALSLFQRLGGYRLLFLICVFIILLKRLTFPVVGSFNPDSYGYLVPSLSLLSGGDYVHSLGRAFPYPLFLFFILKIFHDFFSVFFIQHILGVAGISLLAWTLYDLRTWVTKSKSTSILIQIISLVFLLFVGMSTVPIYWERQIRPEAIVHSFIALCVFFTYVSIKSSAQRTTHSSWFTAATLFASVLLYYIRPSLGLVIGFPFLLMCAQWRQFNLKYFSRVTVGIVLSVFFLILPEFYLSRNDSISKYFGAVQFFANNGEVVLPVLKRDLERSEVELVYDKELIRALADRVEREVNFFSQLSQGNLKRLSRRVDANRLMYDGADTITAIAFKALKTPEEVGSFFNHYNLRMVTEESARYWKYAGMNLKRSLGSRLMVLPEDSPRNPQEHLEEARRSTQTLLNNAEASYRTLIKKYLVEISAIEKIEIPMTNSYYRGGKAIRFLREAGAILAVFVPILFLILFFRSFIFRKGPSKLSWATLYFSLIYSWIFLSQFTIALFNGISSRFTNILYLPMGYVLFGFLTLVILSLKERLIWPFFHSRLKSLKN